MNVIDFFPGIIWCF